MSPRVWAWTWSRRHPRLARFVAVAIGRSSGSDGALASDGYLSWKSFRQGDFEQSVVIAGLRFRRIEPSRQAHAAFEPPVWDLERVIAAGRVGVRRRWPLVADAAHDQQVRLGVDFGAVGIDAGEVEHN